MNYLPDYVTTNEFRFVRNIMIFGKLNIIDKQYFSISLQDDKILDEIFIGKLIRTNNTVIEGVLESIDKCYIKVKSKDKLSITGKDLEALVYGSYEDCPTVSLKHLSELSLCALVNCIKRISILENKFS